MTTPMWTKGLVLASVACISAGLAVSFPTAATAQPAGRAAAPINVATVDLNRVLDNLVERSKVEEVMKADNARREAQLDELRKRMESLKSRLEAMPTNRDTPEHRKLVEEMAELQIQARARKEILERSAEMEMGRAMWSLYLKINDAVKRTALQQGYDLVMVDDHAAMPPEQAQAQMGLKDVARFSQDRQVLYVGPRADLTDQIITIMNNEFNAQAGRRQ